MAKRCCRIYDFLIIDATAPYCSMKGAENPIRYFEYQPGRGGKYPEAFLKGYEGYIHTDAYSGYNGLTGVKQMCIRDSAFPAV